MDNNNFELLIERIKKFNKDRDWDKFHTPENLAKSISIEAAELLECFQWSTELTKIDEIKEELADVMNYCIQLSIVLNCNLIDIINSKITKNENKYPINKCKSKSLKYNEL